MLIHRLRRSRILIAYLLLVLLALSPAGCGAKHPNESATAQPRKVRLVVGIVIDQFRYDYLTRFEDLFGEGGFRRLLHDGAVFTNANYIHTPTFTACGHATFMSGGTPALNGIVGNEWYDRESKQKVTSVSDSSVQLLGGKEGGTGASPIKMLGSTVGDQLRFSNADQSKVIGISLKDRSAILPAGKHPNGAYWFDKTTGTFVSSTYYFNDLPAWVKKFNQEHPASKYFGAKWEKLLPEAAYQRSQPDNSSYEWSDFGKTFPYTVNGGVDKLGARFYEQFETTPFANEYTAAFAKAAIENEKLGQGEQTDLLTVSFSANDLLGHNYGPYSHEVEDMTLRTDRILADFFSYLDQRIGLANTIIVLTADHGVGPIPEYARDLKFGGRVPSKAITEAIQQALDKQFGPDKWITSFVNNNVYFDDETIARRKTDRAEVERVASSAVLKVPGMGACFTKSQLLSGQLPIHPIARSVANGFFAPRSGDLIVVSQPFFLIGNDTTSHGTPHSYDTHVPVIFYGAGITPGSYLAPSSPADIAPTLAALLKIEPPSSYTGRILSEALTAKLQQ